jgi:methionyl-tRNA synthetase
MPAKRTLVTAALPYANGPLHFGHLAGAYFPSDMYVRFKRLRGERVFFVCGSDEHGVPIMISAEKEGVSPQAIVDRFHSLNKSTFDRLGISFDYYARTSSAVHRETSQEIFLTLYEKGFLIAKEEPQLYDEDAKMFLPDRYVEGTCPVCSNPSARGDQCENCGTYLNQTELINPRSKITGNKPVVRATKHWYFALSKFQKSLEAFVDSHTGDWRDQVVQAARSWLKMGLNDRPITRDLDWGVPVPLDDAKGKVLYVWFDAPIGYISATKEGLDSKINPHAKDFTGEESDWRTWWQSDETEWVCFLGKDNIVFHTILFPAMLQGYNEAKSGPKYILPSNVAANEFMNLQGQKLSKSRGWVIEPHDYLDRWSEAPFAADMLRYTFATTFPETKDSDFYWKDFQAHTNNELADILGNLVNRVLTFVDRNFENRVPSSLVTVNDHALFLSFKSEAAEIAKLYDRTKLRDAAQRTMDLARLTNKFFNDAEPWKLIKQDKEKAAEVMRVCLEAIRALAVYFSPIIPKAAEAMNAMLAYDASQETWDNAANAKLSDGATLGKSSILFKKIEDEVVEAEVKRMEEMQARVNAQESTEKKAVAAAEPALDALISIDDFKRIQLKTAKVLEAERVPKSKKLLKLQITIGTEQRQIVAGIGEKYTPEELIGKTVVVVANLKPAKLMGNESQGMLLAVNDASGVVSLITPERDSVEGSEVR